MTDDTQKAIYARVSGRVQGVGFRFSTARQAKKLSLRGYVRNLPDGSVETVAEGDAENIQSLIRWLKKGPPGSYIQDIEHRTISYRGTYRSFSIEY